MAAMNTDGKFATKTRKPPNPLFDRLSYPFVLSWLKTDIECGFRTHRIWMTAE